MAGLLCLFLLCLNLRAQTNFAGSDHQPSAAIATSTNSPRPKYIPAAPPTKEAVLAGLAKIDSAITALKAELVHARAGREADERELGLRLTAKQIAMPDYNSRLKEIRANYDLRRAPFDQQIATLELQAIEIRKRYGIATTATKSKKR